MSSTGGGPQALDGERGVRRRPARVTSPGVVSRPMMIGYRLRLPLRPCGSRCLLQDMRSIWSCSMNVTKPPEMFDRFLTELVFIISGLYSEKPPSFGLPKRFKPHTVETSHKMPESFLTEQVFIILGTYS